MDDLLNVADFEREAERRLDPGAFGYFAGGAGDEVTLRDNVAAFARRYLRPRMLVDVSEVTTETEVLARPVSMPLLVAPTAFQRLAHDAGELATARAAAAAGTVMCLSTLASVTGMFGTGRSCGSANAVRRSRSRLPAAGKSTVSTSASNPASTTAASSSAVKPRSVDQ